MSDRERKRFHGEYGDSNKSSLYFIGESYFPDKPTALGIGFITRLPVVRGLNTCYILSGINDNLSHVVAHELGHSMGGYVALAFAEKYPDNVKGLCLVNSTARSDSLEKQKHRDRAIQAIKDNHKTFIRLAISNLFRPKNRKLFADAIKSLKKEALKTPVQGIIAALEGMKIRADREALLHFGPYKKLMIIGRRDPVLDYDALKNQTKDSNTKVVEFPDGHMSFIENESEFSKEIMHFIE
jgi:pimeloyl-ACP methyl ester carboxylesterase